jgi:UDP-N-acetylglucosamine 4,6-dehydratase
MNMELDSRLLITGGAGYLGRELVRRLIEKGHTNLVAMSRNEGELIKLKEEFPSVEIVPGDISSATACEMAMKDVRGVYHLAAFKHVGMAEDRVSRCILSNVGGTMNLLEVSLRTKPKFVIGISTDKAAQVKGVYGATKFLQEALFREFERANPNTKYRTVRYGNVLYSTGSVLCKWKKALEDGTPITITNPDSTRFYWTVKQAVDLIFDCLENAKDSTPHVTKMKSMRAGDLLDAMIEKYGGHLDKVGVHTIGLQPGENMHEVVADGLPNSFEAERYTVEEITELI